MDEVMTLLTLVLIVVAFAGAVLGVSKWWHRKRVAALREWANQQGWHYEHWRPDLAERFSGYPFGRGRRRRVQHVLTGTHRGHEVLAFEHSYTTSGGRNNSSTTFHEVVAVPIPTPRPFLEVTREHFGHKLLGLVGVHDLQLSNERFNSTFRIRTSNDQFARHVLNKDMTEWLLADGRARQVGIRFDGSYLVTWRRGPLDADNIPADADFLIDVLERVPAPAWETTA
ncbi:hypothetical protein F4561_001537 [Lipingzhangella halophila]|uniref:DUF3137 domain-containing protein n=1 Tax=Lipingzhangella halophila TaxID=1783352 RepID=A0A7W7W195_9ACTN|nr:hypothetical protein [Lipingzhangella halophila]MBB4930717.1 hypothetical protein [Lipingzhangella halophila]